MKDEQQQNIISGIFYDKPNLATDGVATDDDDDDAAEEAPLLLLHIVFLTGERLHGMMGLSRDARKCCILCLV